MIAMSKTSVPPEPSKKGIASVRKEGSVSINGEVRIEMALEKDQFLPTLQIKLPYYM